MQSLKGIKITSEDELDNLTENCVAYIDNVEYSIIVTNFITSRSNPWFRFQLKADGNRMLKYRTRWGNAGWNEWKVIA